MRKVKVAYLENKFIREKTYEKMKKQLLKKLNELSTLCGTEMCAIIFGPSDDVPEVYPSRLDTERVLSKFRNLSESDQAKSMTNYVDLMKNKIKKALQKLKKQQKRNRDMEVTNLMFQCLKGRGLEYLSLDDLRELERMLDSYICDIDRNLERLQREKESQEITAMVNEFMEVSYRVPDVPTHFSPLPTTGWGTPDEQSPEKGGERN